MITIIFWYKIHITALKNKKKFTLQKFYNIIFIFISIDGAVLKM